MGLIKRPSKETNASDQYLQEFQPAFSETTPAAQTKQGGSGNLLRADQFKKGEALTLEKPEIKPPVQDTMISPPEDTEQQLSAAIPHIPDPPPQISQESQTISMHDSQLQQEKEASYQLGEAAGYKKGQTEGLEQGKAQGIEQGRAEERKELKLHAETLISGINELALEKEKVIKASEEEILKLSTHIATAMLQEELQTEPKALAKIVTDALAKISDSDRVIIRTNKAHVSDLNTLLPQFESRLPMVKSVIIQEDLTIEPGGVVVETDLGFIDASITSKAEAILKALLASHNERDL